MGVPLTAGRSIATDLSIFPRGALAYLVSTMPLANLDGKSTGRRPLRRFVLNQDTGAAMKGPERVDLFMGSGEEAGQIAGFMKDELDKCFLENVPVKEALNTLKKRADEAIKEALSQKKP
ncbi:MAG: 3D domain-containing protein [Deltaproteobacteria bacterium]|nr:3D domain-containing protein [Deltaproteobacteria bacterium]